MTVTARPAAPLFGTQVIGQTEKALNAILERQLAGTGLTEPQWVALTLTVVGGGELDRPQLTGRVAGVLKIGEARAAEILGELAAAGLLHVPDEGAATATGDGQALWSRVRATIGEITQQLWGDLPQDELATAGRVLNTVLTRANTLLSAA
ncbi:hypothetical protein [Nonomuraea indica]|uniref:MarR family transcriptional regulator n=1 Tax=Nonomuraea indica TaxID=1581193 RepID=A0ABW8A904_9ACTN